MEDSGLRIEVFDPILQCLRTEEGAGGPLWKQASNSLHFMAGIRQWLPVEDTALRRRADDRIAARSIVLSFDFGGSREGCHGDGLRLREALRVNRIAEGSELDRSLGGVAIAGGATSLLQLGEDSGRERNVERFPFRQILTAASL